MGSEAGYLPAALAEGGTYRITSRVDFLARKFKIFSSLRLNGKGGPLTLNGRFAAEGHFIQCKFGPTARGGTTG